MTKNIIKPSIILSTVLLFTCKSYGKTFHHTEKETIRKPNMLWVNSEDMCPDLGYNGNNLVHTPNLDQLTHRGVRFTNVFTTAPVCSLSRTSFHVGMYQTTIGAYYMRYYNLKPELPDSIYTIMDEFHKNGYVTANIKDKIGDNKTDFSFKTDLKKEYDYPHWKELVKQGKPFYAEVNIHYTHRPFPKGSRDPKYLKAVDNKIPLYYPHNIVSEKVFSDYFKSIDMLDKNVDDIIGTLKKNNISKSQY